MAIEVCVDISNHVIADRALRAPTTYAEIDAAIVVREHLEDFTRFWTTVLRWMSK